MKKIIFIFFIILTLFQFAEAQWIQQNSGTNQNLYDIEFINDKTGWAVGDAGVVIKTTDGGMNWINIANPSPMLNPNLWSVAPVDSNIVYITSGKDLIIRTNNGGLNWSILNFCPNCNSAMTGVYFLNKDTGWFLGTNKVFRTYDGGITLDSFYAPWFTNFDIYFKDINNGIFCGSGRVFKSTDGGMNWYDTNVPTIGVFYEFRKLAVANNNVWVTGSGNPPVYRSTDFCETWEVTDTIRNTGIIGLGFINSEIGFAGGGLNKLFKTTNSGFNWYQENTGTGVVAFISSIYFFNQLTGWYVSGAGKIFHTTTGGQTLVSSSFTKETIPDEFKLFQNYPNPFNPSTNIKYEIPQDNFVSIKIYNLLGKEVMNLINDFKKAGRYDISFNGSNLASGVYYYKIKAGEFVQIRKMVLIK